MLECKICSKKIELCYIAERNAQLVTHQMCFKCNFWRNLHENRDDASVVVSENNMIKHYHIGLASVRRMRGFGGQKFCIRFFDGRMVSTKNLWHQGTVPVIWYDKFQPNAEFVIGE